MTKRMLDEWMKFASAIRHAIPEETRLAVIKELRKTLAVEELESAGEDAMREEIFLATIEEAQPVGDPDSVMKDDAFESELMLEYLKLAHETLEGIGARLDRLEKAAEESGAAYREATEVR